jgi:hypothetical protein
MSTWRMMFSRAQFFLTAYCQKTLIRIQVVAKGNFLDLHLPARGLKVFNVPGRDRADDCLSEENLAGWCPKILNPVEEVRFNRCSKQVVTIVPSIEPIHMICAPDGGRLRSTVAAKIKQCVVAVWAGEEVSVIPQRRLKRRGAQSGGLSRNCPERTSKRRRRHLLDSLCSCQGACFPVVDIRTNWHKTQTGPPTEFSSGPYIPPSRCKAARCQGIEPAC